MRKTISVSLAVVASIVMLSGCSAEEPAVSQASAAAKVFTGTPVEWTVLYRACVEEAGLTTADLPDGDPTGFMIAIFDSTDEQRNEITTACYEQIGEAPMAGLSSDELQRRYDARVSQFECLADLGLVSGPPISFEKFVDDYNRNGQKFLWEPGVVDGVGLSMIGEDGRPHGATDLCPRDRSVW